MLGQATTDSQGSWTIAFAKPADDPLLYILADGGDVGSGPNAAIAFLAAPGALSRLPETLILNERTTVASIYSLVQFLDPGTARNLGAPRGNEPALANAFEAAASLVDLSIGNAIAAGTARQRVINSLGDLLAVCVASSGSASMECRALFMSATPSAGATPTDTRQAVLNVARFPAGPLGDSAERGPDQSATEPQLTFATAAVIALARSEARNTAACTDRDASG